MKKILLIVAVVLCVAVAATALAVSYNPASSISANLSTDTYLALSLESCSTSAITLEPGNPTKYTIQCDVVSRQTSTIEANRGTGTLTIALAAVGEGNVTDVTIRLYNDAACSDAVTGGVIEGANSFSISGISKTEIYYALISVPDDYTAEQCENVGGQMTLSFVAVDPTAA